MNEVTLLNARRAIGEDDCSLWSPREMLQYLIGEMDKGWRPDGIVVCFAETRGECVATGMRRSKSTVMEAVAMIEIAKHDLLKT